MFYQGGKIYHYTHVPGPVARYSAASEYNASRNAGMALEHLSMLNNELLNKDTDVVPEQEFLIILDGKPAICMDKNGNYNKPTRHISRRINFIRNGEE